MPPGTIGFRVRGEIEREDYDDVLTPDPAPSDRSRAWMIPGEARVFRLAELDEAKAWVAAG